MNTPPEVLKLIAAALEKQGAAIQFLAYWNLALSAAVAVLTVSFIRKGNPKK